MKRRTVLWWGLGAVSALVVGWGALPPASRLRRGDESSSDDLLEPNAWVRIGADDSIRLWMPRCEMGQGTHTGLAMLLADELDVDLERILIEAAPIHSVYNNIAVATDGLPFHPDDDGLIKHQVERLTTKAIRRIGVMVTGGSTSIKDLWDPLREAGAMARETLLAAAVRAWSLPSAEGCRIDNGVVIAPDGRRVRYGELVAREGGELQPATAWRVKDATERRIIGRSRPRLPEEVLAKVTGRARFALDIQEPDMLFALVDWSPYRDGRMAVSNADALRKMPGVVDVVSVPALAGGPPGLAVLASNRWQAERALGQLVAQWVAGEGGTFSDADLERELQSALEDPSAGHRYRNVGDVDAVFELPERGDVARTLTADYAVPFLAHAAMEPLACAVKFETDRATIWAGVQIPDVARSAAAKVFELDAAQVTLESLYLGGAFGRRLEADFIAQAAAIAKAVPGRLVQVSWRREDDTRNDFFRPAARARLRARLDDAGQIVAFAAHSSGQSIVKQSFERVFGLPAAGPDKTTAEGAFDQPYEFAHHRVTHRAVDLPVPVGYWRSVGHSQQAFFTETFIDELARLAGLDSVEFRARHLRDHPRHLAVLRLAAEKARWDTPAGYAADGAPIVRGIALNQSFGSIVAEVVEASLSPEGEPRVHRVVVAVDCGVAINPNLIEQQMESAVIYALSAALYGQIHFNEGRVEEGNFDRYRVLRLAETPIIETHIQPSNRPPGGVGEPGVPPLAPALANAVAVLTGKPVRRLPLIGA